MSSPSLPVFRYPLRVTYAMCTLGNHVYYSRYLDMLETARGEFFRQLDQPLLRWQEAGVIFPVLECKIRYRGMARYDQIVTVEVRVLAAAGIRLNLAYRILDEANRVLVEAETLHVCTSLDDKPRRVPRELQEALQPGRGAGGRTE